MAPSLSVCILGQNQAARLPRLLEHVNPVADEIIYVDGGSTDHTPSVLANVPKVNRIERPFDGNFARQRNHAIDAASGEWILMLDTDELLGPIFLRLLPKLLQSNFSSVNIPRYWIASEDPPKYVRTPKHYPDRQLRLFRRSPTRRYDEARAVHETIPIELRAPCLKLRRAHLLHYCLLWTAREEREKKVARYEGLKSAGINSVYLFENTPHEVRACREGYYPDGRVKCSVADYYWERARLLALNPRTRS